MLVIAFDDVEARYECSRITKRISKSSGKEKCLSCYAVIRKYCK